MKFLGWIFCTLSVTAAKAYDCSTHTPFIPMEYQDVNLYVGHFMWKDSAKGKDEIVEEVCTSQDPLRVPIFDIRGREEEWYYCHKSSIEMSCETTFQGRPAQIQVKPAIVIRRWGGAVGRDSHFHAYVIPGGDPTKYFDLFARHISPSLSSQSIVLDAAGGGRGENSGIDSFYVRADFK